MAVIRPFPLLFHPPFLLLFRCYMHESIILYINIRLHVHLIHTTKNIKSWHCGHSRSRRRGKITAYFHIVPHYTLLLMALVHAFYFPVAIYFRFFFSCYYCHRIFLARAEVHKQRNIAIFITIKEKIHGNCRGAPQRIKKKKRHQRLFTVKLISLKFHLRRQSQSQWQ